jgi:predicted metal-dependent peptidase
MPPEEEKPWNEKPDPNEKGGDGPGKDGQGTKPKLVSKKIDTAEDLKKFWEDKLEEAKDRHGGDIPGELMRAIEKLLGVKVDWKQELRKMVSSLSSKADYFLPNRRFLATGAQWGSKKKKESFESLVIIADTSGSVSQKELEQFVSEAMDIMESFKPKETFLIWCDTTVYEPVDVIKKGETWNYRKAYGGGGTSFIPPVVWIEENIIKKGKKLGPVLFFTDGEPNTGPNGGWPLETEYSIRSYVNKFFWIILGEGGVPRKHVKVPFGKRIDLIM